MIPIVLNVPFAEWPPKQIGTSLMDDQFATEAGDLKIVVLTSLLVERKLIEQYELVAQKDSTRARYYLQLPCICKQLKRLGCNI